MKPRLTLRRFACAALFAAAVGGLSGPARAALSADELVLIVNSNEPAGLELARYYAQKRHVPDGRILTLDLPVGDEMPTRQYQEQVVPAVRAFLTDNKLDAKVKCLVPFYGVPLRLAQRTDTPAEARELTTLQQELTATPGRLKPAVEKLEGIAKRLDPDYKPPTDKADMDGLNVRTKAAAVAVQTQMQTIGDPGRMAQLNAEVAEGIGPWITGRAGQIQGRMQALRDKADRTPAEVDALNKDVADYQAALAEAGRLEGQPYDADARQRLRDIGRVDFSGLHYVKLLQDQADFLDPNGGGSAFDNELALARWNIYQRKGWVENPLNYRARGGPNAGIAYLALMVCRLDGPAPQVVRQMIDTSVTVEHGGLRGKVVIDGLGSQPGQELPGKPGYAAFDQTLAGLNRLLADHAKLDVVFDQKPEVLPPHSATDVAAYCGWYAVDGYVPSCSFAPGAVGYHVASYTMRSLRTANQTNWATGLLTDGCVATVGPVAEPFLVAFPRADDFFPLLMTGKLTLAEVYWQTEPTASWMMTCVGDPLYTPYKADPPLETTDLPYRLRAAFQPIPTPGVPPTTQP